MHSKAQTIVFHVDDLVFGLGATVKAEKFIWKYLVFVKIGENYTLTYDVIMTSWNGQYMIWKI